MYLRIALVVVLVALAGCGSNSNSTPSTTNASSSVITLETATGAPVANTVVSLSTDIANNAPVNVQQTATTNASGQATFYNIPANGVYCVSATVGSANNSTFEGVCLAPFPATYTLN
jgi:ABC-type Fe3+-hydroxamate transport system substrate-binding protein